ncbi:MAG: hypothetical protein ACXABY_36950 [Candidatus Thorarchaeota archaeon]
MNAEGLNYAEWQKWSDFSRLKGKLIKDVILTNKGKKSFLDSFIFLAGVAGGGAASVFTGNWLFAMSAAGVVAGRAVLQSPRFRSAFASRMMALADDDIALLRKALDTNKHTVRSRSVVRKVFRDLKPIFPEIRLVGKATAVEQPQ